MLRKLTLTGFVLLDTPDAEAFGALLVPFVCFADPIADTLSPRYNVEKRATWRLYVSERLGFHDSRANIVFGG